VATATYNTARLSLKAYVKVSDIVVYLEENQQRLNLNLSNVDKSTYKLEDYYNLFFFFPFLYVLMRVYYLYYVVTLLHTDVFRQRVNVTLCRNPKLFETAQKGLRDKPGEE
jgi:hypothetical protein